MNLTSWLIIAGAVVALFALIILVLALRYRKVGPNEALIIAGGRKRTIAMADGTTQKIGYRYRLGGGVFVWPGIEKVYVLPMDIIPVSIRTPEVLTNSGVPIMAEASAQVKIDSSDETIHRAAEQFLGIGRDGIRDVVINVLEGKVREVIGGMSVEEIYRGRQEF
jgi:flotillin